MQVDWLTVSAQWVNFLILMWLLRRFLYRPVIRSMDRRQRAIEARLEEADQKVRQAEQEAEHYRNKLSELEAHRSQLIAAARNAADAEREKLVEQARGEIDAMSAQWRREIEREKSDFQTRLRRELGRLIAATARKALLDLASLELEQALFAHFLGRLHALSPREKRLLIESANGNVVLASSFELAVERRDEFTERLRGALTEGLAVRFEPLPDSRCGLMLITPAYTLEWRVEHYFEELEAELEAAMNVAGQSVTPGHDE
jgi:F-type H+-transporting ATPase subunit b